MQQHLHAKAVVTYGTILTVMTVASFVFWSKIAQLLVAPLFDFSLINLQFTLTVLISFSFIGAAIILLAILSNAWWISAILCLITASTLFMLPLTPGGIVILGVIIFISFILIYFSMRHDLTLHTRLVISHIFIPRLSLMIIIFSIIVSGLLYITTTTKLKNSKVTFPGKYLDSVVKITEPFMKEQIQSQQDALINAMIASLDQQLPYLADIPKDDKIALLNGQLPQSVYTALTKQGFSEKQIRDLVNQIASQTTQKTGTDLTDSILQQVRTQVEDLINNILNANKQFLPWVLTITTFFTLTSLGIVVKYLSVIFAKSILILLSLFGLIQKQSISMPVERYAITGTSSNAKSNTPSTTD